jgi:hypothetical protein
LIKQQIIHPLFDLMIIFKKILKYATVSMFILGVFLFSLDLLRFVFPLRSEELYRQPLRFPDKIVLSPDEALKKIEVAKNLPDKEFAIEINGIIHNSIINYWGDDKKNLYRIQVPIFRNYILYFLSRVTPRIYDKYEFCDYRRAIIRGVGFCSQQTLAMQDVLREKGIPSTPTGLDGHVVLSVEIDKMRKEYWVFDPNYDVIIEHSLKEIENTPEIIRPYYQKRGYDEKSIDYLISIFGPEGNIEYLSSPCKIERDAYVFIWAIPIILVSPYLVIKLFMVYRMVRKRTT